jgi:CRP-like cAMP-binding protein
MTERLAPGSKLVEQGKTDADLLILISGELTVLRDGKHLAEIYEAGAYVGETSAFTGRPHSATVVAKTEARVVRVPAKMVPAFFRRSPDAAKKLAHNLSRRLHTTTDKLVEARIERDATRKLLQRVFRDLDTVYDTVLSAPDDQHARIEALNGLRRILQRNEMVRTRLDAMLSEAGDPEEEPEP